MGSAAVLDGTYLDELARLQRGSADADVPRREERDGTRPRLLRLGHVTSEPVHLHLPPLFEDCRYRR
jgi:hypothetical protein